MIKLILLWALMFPQEQAYCRQYEIKPSTKIMSEFGTEKCYKSFVKINIKRDQIIVTSDSIHLEFVIVRRTMSSKAESNREDFLAAIIGRPDQLYNIHKLIDNKGNFYFGCIPTKFNNETDIINGIVFEVSNIPICK